MKKLWVVLMSLWVSACSTTTDLYAERIEYKVQQVGYVEQKIRFTDDSSEIHYWDNQNNDKPIVILLHGVGGDAISNWQKTMLALNDDYHVIVPDILWYGQSTSNLPANLESQIKAMTQFMAVVAPEKPVNLVGHSYGGFMTYGLMANTNHIASATIISSPGGSFDQHNLQEMLEGFGVSKPSELFVPNNDEEFKRLVNASSYHSLHVPAVTLDGVYEHYFSGNAKQKSIMLDHLIDSRDDLVQKINAKKQAGQLPPIQLIWGEQDRIFPLDSGMRLAKELDAPLYIVTESAHNILIEKPSIVNRLLTTFLKQQETK
ncbi:MAG: alpha/beta fold hydrolase [Vibrio sp.]